MDELIRHPADAAALDTTTKDRLALPVAAWLDSKNGKSGSARTREAYAATLAEARAALSTVGMDLDSEAADVALVLQAWSKQSRVEGRNVKPATVAQRLAVVSSFYGFVIRRQLLTLTSNPADLVERPKVEAYDTAQPLDPAKVRAALRTLTTDAAGDGLGADLAARDLALLRVMLTTGRRVAEIAALRWGDVQTDGQRVTLNTRRAKGGKVMRDTLAASVAADVLRWLSRRYGADLGALAADAPIWPILWHGGAKGQTRVGQPMTTQGIAEIVKRRLDTHPHALRHSFAQAMERSGAKVSEIQARLGHSSLQTTGRYLSQLGKAENPHADELARLFAGEEEPHA